MSCLFLPNVKNKLIKYGFKVEKSYFHWSVLVTDIFVSFEVKKEFHNKHNSRGKSVKTLPSW